MRQEMSGQLARLNWCARSGARTADGAKAANTREGCTSFSNQGVCQADGTHSEPFESSTGGMATLSSSTVARYQPHGITVSVCRHSPVDQSCIGHVAGPRSARSDVSDAHELRHGRPASAHNGRYLVHSSTTSTGSLPFPSLTTPIPTNHIFARSSGNLSATQASMRRPWVS